MPKAKIDCDEHYPYYSIERVKRGHSFPRGLVLEFTDAELRQIERAETLSAKAQELIVERIAAHEEKEEKPARRKLAKKKRA